MGITLSTILAGISFSAVNASANTVTVQAGDTVAKIAKANNTTVEKIQRDNSLANVNLIFVGDKLEVDNEAHSPINHQKSASHTTATTGTTSTNTAATTSTSGSTSSAKSWIANKESGGSYTASNGNYYGKYQLTKSLLNGDYSAANQEKVANSYVNSRYGSWSAAKSFWQANGWY